MNTPVMERHWHWEFIAHDEAPSYRGEIHWPVAVSVVGYLCEADARVAAQDIFERPTFVLRRVWECTACGFQNKMVSAVEDFVANNNS